jgi:hypothetical protein
MRRQKSGGKSEKDFAGNPKEVWDWLRFGNFRFTGGGKSGTTAVFAHS